MAISVSKQMLEKLEQLLSAMGFKIRYEKGNFKTGSCLLEENKIIVINKFSNLEVKISALASLIKASEFEINNLPEKQRQIYFSLMQTELFK